MYNKVTAKGEGGRNSFTVKTLTVKNLLAHLTKLEFSQMFPQKWKEMKAEAFNLLMAEMLNSECEEMVGMAYMYTNMLTDVEHCGGVDEYGSPEEQFFDMYDGINVIDAESDTDDGDLKVVGLPRVISPGVSANCDL